MSNGHFANFDYVISEEEVKKIVPDEFAAFNMMLFVNNKNISEYAQDIYLDEAEEEETIFVAYLNLCNSFKEKTDISIYLGYHDSESSGSSYDEVDGHFFCLNWNDMVQLTPAAEKLREQKIKFNLDTWTVYG